VRDERTGRDSRRRVPHGSVQAGEGAGIPARHQARLASQSRPELIVGEREHAALRVLDQHDFPGPQQPLADRQGPDHVGGDDATGVADHVRVTVAQSEQAARIQSRVHARDHRDMQGGHPGKRLRRE
jgi:hypothetical protein